MSISKLTLFYILLLLLCILFLSSFLSLFVFSFWFVVRNNEENQIGGVSSYNYKYLEKDHLLNETSFGIVSFLREIKENEFFSYSNYSLRKEFLISPFGTDEYECFGSCFCEEEDKARRISSSNVLIKGMSYLVAAVSSSIALNIALDYFSNKCEGKYKNVCEVRNIRHQVDECKKSIEEEEEFFFNDPVPIEERVYFCYGNCVRRKNSPEADRIRSNKHIDCKKLKREGKVFIRSDNLDSKTMVEPTSTRMRYTARVRFQREFLVEFCKRESVVDYIYENRSKYNTLHSGEERIYVSITKKTGSICASSNQFSGKSSLENVNCRQVQPPTTSKNNEYMDRIWWEKKKEWDEM